MFRRQKKCFQGKQFFLFIWSVFYYRCYFYFDGLKIIVVILVKVKLVDNYKLIYFKFQKNIVGSNWLVLVDMMDIYILKLFLEDFIFLGV